MKLTVNSDEMRGFTADEAKRYSESVSKLYVNVDQLDSTELHVHTDMPQSKTTYICTGCEQLKKTITEIKDYAKEHHFLHSMKWIERHCKKTLKEFKESEVQG